MAIIISTLKKREYISFLEIKPSEETFRLLTKKNVAARNNAQIIEIFFPATMPINNIEHIAAAKQKYNILLKIFCKFNTFP